MAGWLSRRRRTRPSRQRATASGTVRSSTWLSRLFFIAGIASVFGTLLGFGWFGDHVASLKTPDVVARADGAAALTGGSDARVSAGVALVEAGKVPRLLISGVNLVTTPEQLRLVSGGKPETFVCCIDLGRQAIDTLGNAQEVAIWVKQYRVKKLILITDNYHMPRSLFEVRRANPDVQVIPYPITIGIYADADWWKNERATRGLALEYAKYLVARSRAFVADLSKLNLL
jgi:uncharacterized SAM-binding protein YcdF (DUF218 family)